MSKYDYACTGCSKVDEREFPLGTSLATITCKCGSDMIKIVAVASQHFNGPTWSGSKG